MAFPEARLLVFAKAPVAGRVKTRLIPVLGADGACALHARLVRHTLATAVQADVCPVELWCAPSAGHPFFEACQREFGVTLHVQSGKCLGERMSQALEHVLQRCPYAVLIGTDCPALTMDDLRQALTALEKGVDAVLGPAEDGGYVLIGLRRHQRPVFDQIPWGTSAVLDETRERLSMLRWNWEELPVRWDVDRPEDVARFLAHEEKQGRAEMLPPAG